VFKTLLFLRRKEAKDLFTWIYIKTFMETGSSICHL